MKYQTALKQFERINKDVFSDLIDCRFFFTRSRDNYGIANHNGVGINPRIVKGLPELSETIYHELIHVFIDDVLDSPDDGEHGTIYWTWYFRLLPQYIKAHYYDD